MRSRVTPFVVGFLVTGCYTLQPVMGGATEPGTQVSLSVTDAGRMALSAPMGDLVDQVEGRLVGRDNGDYVIAVSNIKLTRGGEQTWNGERVVLKSDYVGRTYEKRFSRGRTVALSAAAVGALAYVALGTNLLGFGNTGQDADPGPPGGQDLRFGLRFRLP